MRRQQAVILVVGVLMLLAARTPAVADVYTFTFNSLGSGISNGAIETYMNGVLGAGRSVDVTGAITNRTYTGDGHVVGPCWMNGGVGVVPCNTTPASVKPVTLGYSDGSVQHLTTPDTFLKNNNVTTITMLFSGFEIYSVKFDYEIFPDGTCPTSPCSASNWPDFTFKADGVQVFRTLAVVPGNPGAPYTHSPNSGWSGTERAPQFLGESGEWFFPEGVTKLEFIDWPRTIGIDNLVIGTPEPASIVLLGTFVLASLGAIRRKRLS